MATPVFPTCLCQFRNPHGDGIAGAARRQRSHPESQHGSANVMTPAIKNCPLSLRKALRAHWRAALITLALVLPLAVWAAEAPAACDLESVGLPVHSRMLSDHLLEWMEPASGDADLWRSTRASALCGDAQAIARLREEPGNGVTGMLALVTLINLGDRELTELPSALGTSGLSDDHSAVMLSIGYAWMVAEHVTLSVQAAVADTQWAVDSKNPDLSEAGWELRAVFQDPIAVERRGQRLADCAAGADAHVASFHGCLTASEQFTASKATVTRRWNDAPPKERQWLTLWAAPTESTAQFFLDQLLQQTQAVQHSIMANALGPHSENPSLAIKGALLLLQQALDDPGRRPEAIAIDFSSDYGEAGFGEKAYGSDYPVVLQAAFDELATYPDVAEPMKRFAALDHPWLATQAGFWLFRHGHGDAGRTALRYTLEADGLPPVRVLGLLVPINDGELPNAARTLFVDVVLDGMLGKWYALAEDGFKPLLSEPEIVDLLRQRVASIPGRVKRIHGAFKPYQPMQEQMQGIPGLKDEMQALEWVVRALVPTNPAAVDDYIETFASESEDPWQAIAMTLAANTGRSERAQTLAQGLTESPWPAIAAQAKEVLAPKGGKPNAD